MKRKGLSFKGNYALCVDNKGRINIPTTYVNSLKADRIDGFRITTNEGFGEGFNYLTLHPTKKIIDSYKTGTRGRIRLPKELMDFANIETNDNVVIIGMLNELEIWSEESYRNFSEKYGNPYDEMYRDYWYCLDLKTT